MAEWVVSDIPTPSQFDLHCLKLHMDESCGNLKRQKLFFKSIYLEIKLHGNLQF
jgi:hypothetical protein